MICVIKCYSHRNKHTINTQLLCAPETLQQPYETHVRVVILATLAKPQHPKHQL